MLFMNDYDIDSAVIFWEHTTRRETPQTHRLAEDLRRLANWANQTSDGWAYWPKPCRAAKALQERLQEAERQYRDGVDLAVIEADSAEARARVLRPIKAFLTRQGVAHSEVLR